MKYKISFTILLIYVCFSVSAQTDPNNVPKPPTEKLSKFKQFYGKWQITANYANLKFTGTMEFKPAIKGWYVERTIKPRSADGKIDREFRSMITWDEGLGHYRIWRFETVPPAAQNEGKMRFVGDTLIEEWEFVPGHIFRNKSKLLNKYEMETITEEQDNNGKITHIGLTKGKRAGKK